MLFSGKMKRKALFFFFSFFVLSVAWVCWIENIWVLFIGFQDTLGIEQGRGAIVVTSEKEKKISNLFLSVFLLLHQSLWIENNRWITQLIAAEYKIHKCLFPVQ